MKNQFIVGAGIMLSGVLVGTAIGVVLGASLVTPPQIKES